MLSQLTVAEFFCPLLPRGEIRGDRGRSRAFGEGNLTVVSSNEAQGSLRLIRIRPRWRLSMSFTRAGFLNAQPQVVAGSIGEVLLNS